MPLLPLSAILAVVKLLTELLRTFNGLPEDVRARVMVDILDDKDARDALWTRFTGWIGGLFNRIEVTK